MHARGFIATAVLCLRARTHLRVLAIEAGEVGVLNDKSGVYPTISRDRLRDCGAARGRGESSNRPGSPSKSRAPTTRTKSIGTAITRRWLERESVEMIIDVPNSAIALGVNTLARDLNKVFIASGAGTADLTGKACSPNTVHWTYDTWEAVTPSPRRCSRREETVGISSPRITPSARTSRPAPAKRSADWAARSLGSARVPLGASDFSSFLLQAQSAKPKVIAMAKPAATSPTRSSKRQSSA